MAKILNWQKTNWLILVLTLIVSLAGVEILIRWYETVTRTIEPLECRRIDPLFHHGLASNKECRWRRLEWDIAFSVNSLGLRDREIGLQKDQNIFRIIVLGDSFTEGQGVSLEHIYPRLLEQELDSEEQKIKFEVINAGVASYSPILEYLWLRERGMEMDPDMVILSLDVNDFFDELKYERELIAEEKVLEPAFSLFQSTYSGIWQQIPYQEQETENQGWFPFIPKSVKFFINENFHFYAWLRRGFKKITGYFGAEKPFPVYEPFDPKSDWNMITRNNEVVDREELWLPLKKNLLRIKELLSKQKVNFVIVLYPHGHQVDGNEWSRGRQIYGFEKGKTYSTKVLSVLTEWTMENEIMVINTLEDFKQATKKPLFFDFDGHFTENGHQVMAEAINRQLVNIIKVALQR